MICILLILTVIMGGQLEAEAAGTLYYEEVSEMKYPPEMESMVKMMPGMISMKGRTKVYIQGSQQIRITDSYRTVEDFASGTILTIDFKKRTFSMKTREMRAEQIASMFGQPDFKAKASGAHQMLNPASYRLVGKKGKVSGKTCHFVNESMTISMEVSGSKNQFKSRFRKCYLYPAPKAFSELSAHQIKDFTEVGKIALAKHPKLKGKMNFTPRFSKLKEPLKSYVMEGMPIYSRQKDSMPGVPPGFSNTTRFLKIREGVRIPPALWKVPKGYRKVEAES